MTNLIHAGFPYIYAMCYNYDALIKDEETGALFNRYKLRPIERKEIEERNRVWRELQERLSFYYANGFDHRELPVITMERPDEIQFYRWGLIPHWIKDRKAADELSMKTLNARSETVFTLPSFRGYIKTQRCLVIATGFYEWRDVAGKKYPYHIKVKDETNPEKTRLFSFGGIYSSWVDKEGGEVVNSFSIITTPANELMSVVHNSKQRMPLILSTEDELKWLSPVLNEAQIKELMKPYPSHLMVADTITKLITARGVNRNVPEIYTAEQYTGVEGHLDGAALFH